MANKKLVQEIVELICAGKPIVNQVSWDDAPLLHEAINFALDHAEKHCTDNRILFTTTKNPVIFRAHRQTDVEAYINNDLAEVCTAEVIDVPNGYATHRENIVAKRNRLQAEIDELDRRLREKDIH